MICNYFPEPAYLIFTSELPDLFYYSHIPVAVAALLIGSFVFFNNRQQLPNKLLFGITLCFSLWIVMNIIAWTNIHSEVLMFVWPFLAIFSSLISVLSIYFIHVFLSRKDASVVFKSSLLILIAPILILAPTNANISGFDIINCDAFMFEGYLYKAYYATVNIVAMGWILVMLIRGYHSVHPKQRIQVLLMGIGMEFFLFIFFSIVFLAQYLTVTGVMADSRLEMWGLIGMAIFIAMLGYLIVKYEVFHTKLLATQALVATLMILVGAEFFFIDTTANQILVGITLLGTFIGGYFLVESVKREIEQKKLAQQLATELAGTNAKLERLDKMKSEFVSIASHQLRSPLTSVRGYISMILEGSYGEVPPKIGEVLNHVSDAARHMAFSIEDYLNVSRIEAGNMKYDLTDVDVAGMVNDVVTEMLPVSEKKGIPITFKRQFSEPAAVKLDVGKVRQITQNLIDNALKYTADKGAITVVVRKDETNRHVFIDVIDQGIGLSEESRSTLFEKFERAKNANHINVTGTGLGLYIARTMARAMGGDITVTSAGEGKGSTFTVSFPLNGIESSWSSKS